MKILILTPHYPPRQGGTSDYVARLSAELQERGHQIKVITRDGNAASTPVEVCMFGAPWSLRSLSKLVREIRRYRPNVLLLQYGPYAFNRRGPGMPVVSLVISASLITKTPFVVYGHELYQSWNHSWLRTPWHFWQRVATVLMIMFSRRFVLTIESRRSRLANLFPWWSRRIGIVPITPTLDQEVTNPDWRAEHGIPVDTALLSAMGTDDPVKGARLLGGIADSLAARGIAFKFVTVGGLRPAHPGIDAWGYVSAHDAWNLVAASDLFVMPYGDGVSARRTTVLNALAAGTAVLTTQGVNTDETLFPPSEMAMVPAGQAAEMIEAAVAILSDPARQAALRLTSLRLAEQFAWPRHVSQWEALLREALSKT